MKFSIYNKEKVAGYLFILAPILQFFIFALGPLIYSFYASFTDWDGLTQPSFIGLENYKEIVLDDRFWKALYNTIFYMIGIPIGMFLSIILALLMNQKLRGISIYRVIYYIPNISSLVAIAILWQWIYNPDYGILNNMLYKLFHIQGPNWLYNTTWVKPAIIIVTVWRGLGYSTLLYLAGLQNIPHVYYEAAEIDGASSLKKFIYITLPLLTPTSFYIVVTTCIGGLQMFVEPQILANNGGPEYSAATVVFYLWQKAFINYDMGYACAVAWILGAIIFVVTLIQFKYANKWVYGMD